MTYTSLNFIFFVLATALVYFVLPFKKYRWTVLLAASIFFYCTWSYQLGAFMLFTTLSTYLIALWLNRVSLKSKAVLKEHKSEWSRDDKKKYKNKKFAAGCNRDIIRQGAELVGLDLPAAIAVCIDGMKPYAAEVGLLPKA